MEKRLQKKCCFCGKELSKHGNDAWPLDENGRCCNECNYKHVIPARIKLLNLK